MKRDQLVLPSLLDICRIDTNFLVIFFEGSKVLSRFREFTLFHTLANIPVDECPLRVQQVELVVESTPSAGNGSRVRQHTQASRDLGEVTTWDVCWRFVANTEFEACRAPVNELDRASGLDDANCRINVLGHDVTAVEKRTRHYQIWLKGRKILGPYDVLYLPSRGSHFTIWLPVSKHEKVISATEFCSWCAFSAEMMGAKVASGK